MRVILRDYLKNNDINIKDGIDLNKISCMYRDMDVSISRDGKWGM